MNDESKAQPAQPADPTPEQQKELQQRTQDFNAELMPLLKKYRFGLGASAFLLPDGRIAARTVLLDDTPKETTAQVAAKSEAAPAAKLSEG